MAKMYLMCGCSGSGKTTYAKEFATKHNLKYLGVDEFYAKLNGDECLHINSFEVWIEFFKAIHKTEIDNIDCIIDTNAITKSYRDSFISWFPTFEHHLIYIDTNVSLRKKNNMSRRRQIPNTVMDEMAEQLEIPCPTSEAKEWRTITFIKNNNNNFAEPYVMKGD